ncbi:MAG: exonuclease domain-containing protein [bacterium]|nr:exonuclease domain-containing protein [bacterium]
MGIFNLFKKNNEQENLSVEKEKEVKKGNIELKEIFLNLSSVEILKKKYIAFDVETTGLNPVENRIVELGAVLFENGIPIKKFSSLVNPNQSISHEAMRVNNISNDMIKNSPDEKIVFSEFLEFLGDSLSGETIICAHNARFDLEFLTNTLERLGYNGNIRYIDTLGLSRDLLYGLENYKQCTIAKYFNLVNEEAHRAVTDAETCGKILFNLLDYKTEKIQEKAEKNNISLDDYEKIIFAYVEKLINDNGLNINYLGARKTTSGYISICYLYSFLKYKFCKKGKYLIIDNKFAKNIALPTESCNISEGGSDFVRVYFNSLDDIKQLERYILKEYKKAYSATIDYIHGNSRKEKNVIEEIENLYQIPIEEVDAILNEELQNKNLSNYLSEIIIEKSISREDIIINPINDRVPLDQIKNLNDWSKGYDEGNELWARGDELRKNGEYCEAIKLFNLSRYNGYNAPVLYESFAMAYHQLKDYDNEIDILEEGIERLHRDNVNVRNLITRRDKAVQTIYKKIEQEKQIQQKRNEKEEKRKQKEEEKLKTSSKETINGRVVIQMDDNGNIIKKYISIAEAVRQTGVNSKSIRDAATGVQKHAGGYCWKYEDDEKI